MLSSVLSELRRGWRTLASLGLAQVAVLAAGIVSAALLARFFTKETYGQYQLVLAWIGIVGPFCLVGLRETLKIAAARQYHGNIAVVLRYWGLATSVAVAVLVLLALWYWRDDRTLAAGLLVGALLFPLTRLEGIWTPWLMASQALKRLSWLRIVRAGLSAVAVVILVVANQHGLVPLVALAIALPGVVGVWSVVEMLRQRQNRIRDTASVRFGLHVSAASMLQGLLFSDRVIIAAHLSGSHVAVWAIALLFPTQVKMIANIFMTYLTPALYRSESLTQGWQLLRRALPALLVFFVGIGLIGYFALPVLLPLLFSERYVDAVPYGRLLWLVHCLIIPGNFLDQIMRAHQKKIAVYGQSVAYPLLLLALNLWLVRYGLTGVLVARIVTYGAHFAFMSSVFVYYLRQDRTRGEGDAHGNPAT